MLQAASECATRNIITHMQYAAHASKPHVGRSVGRPRRRRDNGVGRVGLSHRN